MTSLEDDGIRREIEVQHPIDDGAVDAEDGDDRLDDEELPRSGEGSLEQVPDVERCLCVGSETVDPSRDLGQFLGPGTEDEGCVRLGAEEEEDEEDDAAEDGEETLDPPPSCFQP